ncbi:hypothetical protein FAUST_10299 [Fusarium austroamericanum]|uniref:Transmembrane protein n=1 Tax=Fusarium austroamericanum TaxID=282268 RepID=A0AAN5Z1I7_FUSAU|nr:hypothetical protein FAUST_10299 [Fusarium austroamericanum]
MEQPQHVNSPSHMPTWHENKSEKATAMPSRPQFSSSSKCLEPLDADRMDLRYIFANRLMPVAFALPWVASMVISCIPFTRISLIDAPDFLILAALISIVEVLSIVAVFIYASLRSDDDTNSTFKEKCLRAWFWFLFISPFVTGTMVVLMASDISCDLEDDLDMHQPICQVGIRLIKATALCRAGIIASFLFATSSWLERRPRQPTNYYYDPLEEEP